MSYIHVVSVLVLLLVGCDSSSPLDESSPNPTSPSPIEAPNPTPTRIMPLGDSITQADHEHDSYRRLLWQNLSSSGYSVDFVGSQRSHRGGNAPHDDFDWDHEGHWGWRADEIMERVENWVSRYSPDIVLIHLGTNDVLQHQSVSDTVEELGRIIDELRDVNPHVKVLLAQITPLADPSRNSVIRTLNEKIDQLGKEKDRDESPVIVVDHHTDFDSTSDTYDGIHPSVSGEKKMAERWFGALDGLLTNSR